MQPRPRPERVFQLEPARDHAAVEHAGGDITVDREHTVAVAQAGNRAGQLPAELRPAERLAEATHADRLDRRIEVELHVIRADLAGLEPVYLHGAIEYRNARGPGELEVAAAGTELQSRSAPAEPIRRSGVPRQSRRRDLDVLIPRPVQVRGDAVHRE